MKSSAVIVPWNFCCKSVNVQTGKNVKNPGLISTKYIIYKIGKWCGIYEDIRIYEWDFLKIETGNITEKSICYSYKLVNVWG